MLKNLLLILLLTNYCFSALSGKQAITDTQTVSSLNAFVTNLGNANVSWTLKKSDTLTASLIIPKTQEFSIAKGVKLNLGGYSLTIKNGGKFGDSSFVGAGSLIFDSCAVTEISTFWVGSPNIIPIWHGCNRDTTKVTKFQANTAGIGALATTIHINDSTKARTTLTTGKSISQGGFQGDLIGTAQYADSTKGGATRANTAKLSDSTTGGAARANTAKLSDSTTGGSTRSNIAKLADSTTGGSKRVENGIYTNVDYTNPSWLKSVLGSIVSGSVTLADSSQKVRNGVYTDRYYHDPDFIDIENFTKNLHLSKNAPCFTEYDYTGAAGNCKVSVGMLGNPEANLAFNMDYTTPEHHYYDANYGATWMALASHAWGVQYAPPGLNNSAGNDVWEQGGYRYLIISDTSGHVAINTDMNSFWYGIEHNATLTLPRNTNIGHPSLGGETDLVIEGSTTKGVSAPIFLNAYNGGNILIGNGGGRTAVGGLTPLAKLHVESSTESDFLTMLRTGVSKRWTFQIDHTALYLTNSTDSKVVATFKNNGTVEFDTAKAEVLKTARVNSTADENSDLNLEASHDIVLGSGKNINLSADDNINLESNLESVNIISYNKNVTIQGDTVKIGGKLLAYNGIEGDLDGNASTASTAVNVSGDGNVEAENGVFKDRLYVPLHVYKNITTANSANVIDLTANPYSYWEVTGGSSITFYNCPKGSEVHVFNNSGSNLLIDLNYGGATNIKTFPAGALWELMCVSVGTSNWIWKADTSDY